MERDEKCRALGVKQIASTVFGLGQTGRRKSGVGNRKSVEDDDDEEYRPPQCDFGLVYSDEDTCGDGDDESSRSDHANMVTNMNRGKRSRHASIVAAGLSKATPLQPQNTRSSHAESKPEAAAQATLAQPQVTRSSQAESTPEGAFEARLAQPQVTRTSRADSMPEAATTARLMDPIGITVSSGQPDQVLSQRTPSSGVASGLGVCSRRVQGKTRGLKVQKLRRQLGHAIPIPISASSHAPEGEFATAFANLLGQVIRAEAPVRKEGWKSVPEVIKNLVVKRVQQTFDFGDYVNNPIVRDAVDVKCQKLYRDWKHDLHTHYLSLLEAGVSDPKSHPLEPCKADDWAWMIDHLWENMECKEKSKKAKVSRSKMPWNHTSGSRSFLARSSMIMAQNDGQAQTFPDFYRNTHYMHGQKKWINEEAQKTHEELLRVNVEQSQPSITSPLTEQQVSIQVLGHRSGYLKGFGVRTKSSLASSQNQTGPDSEVQKLRQQVAELSQKAQVLEGKAMFLEGLVLQLAQRAGIDPNTIVGANGTSCGDEDATPPGLNEH